MVFNLLKNIKDALFKEIVFFTDHITSGSCKNYEEYKWTVGKIYGLNRAVELIQERQRDIE